MEKLRFNVFNGEKHTIKNISIREALAYIKSDDKEAESSKYNDDKYRYKLYSPKGHIAYSKISISDNNYIGLVKWGSGAGKTFFCEPNSSVVWTMGALIAKKGYSVRYFYYRLNYDFFHKFINTSTTPNLYFRDFADERIKTPSYEEQEKIGGFLSLFDKLIQKQQDKISLLKELKKGYLQQMFPVKGSNIPKIRFKGFADAWEQCKFKDLFVKLQNNSLSRADLNDENGYAMNVHYGDVLIKFNEILDVNNENIPYITEPGIIEKYKSSFLQNGDIIIADAAEDNTVGKCCEIAGLSHEIVLAGLHTIPCRPSKNFASGYLGYYMNSNVYHDQLLPLIQGSKISSISINTLANTSLVYPKSIEEQLLLANKFRALDSLITLHQRKLEGLEEMKKGYMQRLFA